MTMPFVPASARKLSFDAITVEGLADTLELLATLDYSVRRTYLLASNGYGGQITFERTHTCKLLKLSAWAVVQALGDRLGSTDALAEVMGEVASRHPLNKESRLAFLEGALQLGKARHAEDAA